VPVLLVRKAEQKRKETGDSRYYAPKEADKTDIGLRLYNILAMPFKILFLEPMLIAIAVYQSVSSDPCLLPSTGTSTDRTLVSVWLYLSPA
jgi:hypothetical protein